MTEQEPGGHCILQTAVSYVGVDSGMFNVHFEYVTICMAVRLHVFKDCCGMLAKTRPVHRITMHVII